MTQEKWTQWKPLEGLANEYDIISITLAGKEFKILLGDARDDSPDVRISYNDYFISEFRSTSETFRLSTISYLDKKYGGDFYSEWSFFKIEDSQYLKWLSEQSYGISDDCRLTHFCILTDDDFFDFIASKEPKVEFVYEKI